MKSVRLVIRVLIALFLSIAVVVHLVGPFLPDKLPEPLWSHTVHAVSYGLCFFTFLRTVRYRLLLFGLGAVYPFVYHANCFFTLMVNEGKFNHICFEVIVILPLAALLIWRNEKSSTTQ
jgi:hypothetical protein